MWEAVVKISLKIRTKYLENSVRNTLEVLRDKVIHKYHSVDLEIIGEVIEKKILLRKSKFEKLSGVKG